jgi:iron complex outermembrane receptor protein
MVLMTKVNEGDSRLGTVVALKQTVRSSAIKLRNASGFMNTQVPAKHTRHSGKKSSRGLPITAVVTSLALASPGLIRATEAGGPAGSTDNNSGNSQHSADGTTTGPTVAELQAENARLKQALEAARQQLASQKGATPATTSAAPTASAAGGAAANAAPTTSAAAGAAPPLGAATILASERAPSDADASAGDGDGRLAEVTINSDKEHVTNRTAALEQLKDVPLSISVVSGVDLQQEDAFDIGAITKRAADVSWNQGNQRTSSISIRGVGRVGQNEAEDPSVGVSIDDIPYAFNPLISSVNFIDLDRVEVTRGPQGTDGGKNNSLGDIAIYTKGPTFTPDSDYLLTIGERDTFIGQYGGGGPIIDGLLAFRGTISVEKGQGDIKNLYTTDQTYQNTDRTTGRLQFLLTPSDDFFARLSVNIQPDAGEYTNNRTFYTPTPADYSDGKPVTSVTNDERLTRSWFTQDPNYSYKNVYLYGAGQDAVDIDGGYPVVVGSYGGSLKLDWKLGKVNLTSISGFESFTFNARNDEGTPFAVSTTGGVYDNAYGQYSQEFRLSSTIGSIADYTTGVYLLRQDTNYSTFSNWLQDAGAWYANNSQYATLDADGNGRYLMENSVNAMWKDQTQDIRNKSGALFGQINWHLSDPLNVITGARVTYDDRHNSGTSYLSDEGNGSALNPVAVNGVELGGFSTTSAGNLATTNSAAQIATANAVAAQYFNAPSYAALTAGEKAQIAAAQALRKTQIGVLWANTAAQPYNKTTPGFFFSPSYKLTDSQTAYVSYQHGEKAGISQLVNGVSYLVKPERTDAYEVGLKSSFLNQTLILNADAFFMNIHDYQQSVEVLDAYTTALQNNGSYYYTSATGNAQWVVSKGFELDAAYRGIPHTTIRFSGAYVDAYYKSFTDSPQPVEGADAASAYKNISGQALPGAARVTADLGAEYRQPVLNGWAAHFGFDTLYTGRNNTDSTGALSTYAWVPGGSITDADIGFGKADNHFDVALVVKNLTNNDVPVLRTWNSYEPAFARWWGLQVTGKL